MFAIFLFFVELWITLSLLLKSFVFWAVSCIARYMTIGPFCGIRQVVTPDGIDLTLYAKTYYALCRYYGDTPNKARLSRWIAKSGYRANVEFADGTVLECMKN